MKLTNRLCLAILARDPKAQVPHDYAGYQKWARHIDLLMRVDGRDEDEIRAVIDFSQNDTFWRTNILSTSSLRKNFSLLYAKMSQPKTSQAPPPTRQYEPRYADELYR